FAVLCRVSTRNAGDSAAGERERIHYPHSSCVSSLALVRSHYLASVFSFRKADLYYRLRVPNKKRTGSLLVRRRVLDGNWDVQRGLSCLTASGVLYGTG